MAHFGSHIFVPFAQIRHEIGCWHGVHTYDYVEVGSRAGCSLVFIRAQFGMQIICVGHDIGNKSTAYIGIQQDTEHTLYCRMLALCSQSQDLPKFCILCCYCTKNTEISWKILAYICWDHRLVCSKYFL